MKQLTPLILISFIVLLLSFQTNNPSVKPSPGDTVMVKIYRTFITPQEWEAIVDTTRNGIMSYYGIELGGNTIFDRKLIMDRQLQKIASRFVIDSVKVVNGKIVK